MSMLKKYKNYYIALIIFFSITTFLFFISSLIFAYTNINDKYLDVFCISSISISSVISSTYLSCKKKKKGIANSIKLVTIQLLILFSIAYILNDKNGITLTFGIVIICTYILGIIGGIIGVNV